MSIPLTDIHPLPLDHPSVRWVLEHSSQQLPRPCNAESQAGAASSAALVSHPHVGLAVPGELVFVTWPSFWKNWTQLHWHLQPAHHSGPSPEEVKVAQEVQGASDLGHGPWRQQTDQSWTRTMKTTDWSILDTDHEGNKLINFTV